MKIGLDIANILIGIVVGVFCCSIIFAITDASQKEENKTLKTQVQCLKNGNAELAQEVKRLNKVVKGELSDLPKFTVDNWKVVFELKEK